MAKEKKMVEAITSMGEDFAKWYTDVVKIGVSRLLKCKRLYGNQAVWIPYLGIDSTAVRQSV